MLDPFLGIAIFALAAFFYAITVYHSFLIIIGMRMTKGGRKPFDKGSLRNPVDLPRVSIVIPAKDEEVVIEGAIRCAERLQYPKELVEILVVEDGSVDETPTIGKRMAALIPNVVCISGGESTGKPAALNRAIARASGEVIVIFDSDTRYEPDLLLRGAKYFHDHPDIDIAQAFPQVINADRNLITRLNYYETRFWFQGLQVAKERFGLFMHLGGTGMFIRRRVLDGLGPWDESCLTEDLEYSVRVARSGHRVGMLQGDIWIQPTYKARHLIGQRRRWWGGALQVFVKMMRSPFSAGRTLRQRLDAFIYTISPIVFLVGSIMFIVSVVSTLLAVSGLAALTAWFWGILLSNLLLIPLVVTEAFRIKDRKLIWLVPGLYWYWTLQWYALFSVAFGMIFTPRKVRWQRTPKVRTD